MAPSLRTVVYASVLWLGLVPALAQVPDVVHAVDWLEVVAGANTPVPSPDGVLQPGEAVRLVVSISFPDIGTPVAFQLPMPGGVAPLAALCRSGFNVRATTALGGGWSNIFVGHGFSTNPNPFPQPDGSLFLCAVAQPSPPLGSVPISTNPLPSVWHAVWTPSTYLARTATLELEGFFVLGQGISPPQVFVSLGPDPQGNPLFGVGDGRSIYGGVTIPIVPSPGAGVLLPLAFACSRRRRRGR